MKQLKNNCYNCKFGRWESEGDYGESYWFECDKRDGESGKFELNLGRESYREKVKSCCVPLTEVKCIECGDVERMAYASDNFICYPCWLNKEVYL